MDWFRNESKHDGCCVLSLQTYNNTHYDLSHIDIYQTWANSRWLNVI